MWRFYLLGKIAQEMMPCLHSTSLKCLGMVYRCSKGKSSSQDTMVSLRGGRPLTYSCSPEAKGLSLSSDPPSHLTSIKPWCYHHHLRVAYKQQAVVHTKVSLNLGCVVTAGVCRVTSLLPFFLSPWQVNISAPWLVGHASHYSYLLFSGRCNGAHYFFSLDWYSPAGRKVMRNLLLRGH